MQLDKVLLLTPPGDKLYMRGGYCSTVSKARYYLPTIDLLVQSGIFARFFDVEVLDAIIEKTSVKEVVERCKQRNYTAVIIVTSSASWPCDFTTAQAIKRASPRTRIIATGGFLLHEGRKYLEEHHYLDAVLLSYVTDGALNYILNPLAPNPWILTREGPNSCQRLERSTPQVQQINYPVPKHELFPLRRYRLAGARHFPSTVILHTFGCPYGCSFCIAATLPVSVRPVGNVLEELHYLKKLGIRELNFCDPTFGWAKRETRELLEVMIKERFGFSWFCNSRVDVLNDLEYVNLFRQAGCHTVLFGVESSSPQTRADAGKNFSLECIRETFRLCRKAGIRTIATFILGLPGDTVNDMKNTIQLALEIRPDFASFNLAIPVHGTKLRKIAERENLWSPQSSSDILDSNSGKPVFHTREASEEETWNMHKLALRRFYARPGYILRSLCRVRSFYEACNLFADGIAVLSNAFHR